MGFVRRAAWCLVTGLLLRLGFPPWDYAVAVWLAPIPWLLAVAGTGARRGLGLGAVFGFGLALPLGSWIPGVLQSSFGAERLAATGVWLALASSYVPPIALASAVIAHVPARSLAFAPLAGVLWALAELSHGRLCPGIPWIALGATQIETPLARAAACIGVHGVSGLVIGAAAALAQAASARPAALLWIGALALTGAQLVRSDSQAGSADTIRIALVQPGVPFPAQPDSRFEGEQLRALEDLTRLVTRADLVVWPESSLRSTLEGRPDLAERVSSLASEIGSPILLGAPRRVGEARHNSAILVRPGAAPIPVYDKLRPLPVAEYEPAWLPASVRLRLGAFMSSQPVSFGEPLEVDLAALGSPEIAICYEAILSGVARNARAGVLLNLVNDGWYVGTAAPAHHLLLTRLRAIETGAPLVRVAATGASALVAPDGRVIDRLPVGLRGALIERVALSSDVTPFERLGYAPLVAAAVLLGSLELRRG